MNSGNKEDCRKNPSDAKYNLTGCLDKVQKVIKDNKISVLGTGVATVVIMVRIQAFCMI